ncbi:DinB family protein [Algibacter pacificus]|uniref:DinB family protein n=1 Tax=Algibacter pacificus TaxID=2599389 RepID=UPI0011C960B5|nr:DinB family protein [Algibacter pacificus]
MDSVFNIWKTNRRLHLKYLKNYNVKQLNTIPLGFNNNLIWNIGHIIVAQQALLYKTAGLEGYISDTMFNTYKPGTKPNREIQQEEIDELKILLLALVELTKVDYQNNLFSNFKPFKIETGFKLNTIEDAILFNNYHEAMHYGIIKSITNLI